MRVCDSKSSRAAREWRFVVRSKNWWSEDRHSAVTTASGILLLIIFNQKMRVQTCEPVFITAGTLIAGEKVFHNVWRDPRTRRLCNCLLDLADGLGR